VPKSNLLTDLSILLRRLNIRNTTSLEEFYVTKRLTYVTAVLRPYIPKGELLTDNKLVILPEWMRSCLVDAQMSFGP
jgi:hypothetical protein